MGKKVKTGGATGLARTLERVNTSSNIQVEISPENTKRMKILEHISGEDISGEFGNIIGRYIEKEYKKRSSEFSAMVELMKSVK